MNQGDEFALLDATAQAALVRSKQISALELVDAAIARVERLNPKLNAVVTNTFDRARDAARGSLPDGPFTGVPFLLKDLGGGAERGVSHTYGSRLLRDHVADYDSELVSRFRHAGLVSIGRSNTPEFGIPPTTEPLLFGPCKNPWSLAHSAGGSSGGAAAAVAARLVPFAHASDAGGSIRIPASCCGVFGLKPTRGRSPMGPKLGESTAGLIAELCVSVSVRDTAALLDAIDAPSLGEPYAAPAKAGPFTRELEEPPGRLRVAVLRQPFNGAPVHADCVAALEAAENLCRGLGHELVDIRPELPSAPELMTSFVTVWSVAHAMSVVSAEALAGRAATPEDIEPLTWALASMGRARSATDYLSALRTFHRLSRELAAFTKDYDVILSPTLARPPVLLGELACPPEDPLRGFFLAGGFAAFTPLYNITGQPAMSVPMTWNGEGLPIGVQFAARFGDEATLFRLAAQLEAAQPWASRLPLL